MSVLKEKECLDRARAACLENVKTLNCWGSDLIDISIIEKMINLEVLNVSVNNIVSLKSFAFCPRLKEVYLRKNKIIDLKEIKYLKRLQQLKILWLSDNPCAKNNDYRNTVLRNLPKLQKLDSITVTPEELTVAESRGCIYENVDKLPNFSGLNLDQTLTSEMVQKCKENVVLLVNEERNCDPGSGFKSDNDSKITIIEESVNQDKKTNDEVLPDHQQYSSNIFTAVMLLLEELSADELQCVKKKTDNLLKKQDKSLNSNSVMLEE